VIEDGEIATLAVTCYRRLPAVPTRHLQ